MKIFRRDTMQLAYEAHGRAEQPPLLLLHNAMSTCRSTWRRVLPPLSAWFYVVGPDLRGHGLSNNPDDRLDLREMADDMAAMLDHLQLPRAHVLAFSGGASLALYLVARYPELVASQVLIGSHYTVRGLRTRGDAFWEPERIEREERAWWNAMLLMHRSEERVRALLRWWKEEDHHRPDLTRDDLARVTAPTLLLVGAQDTVTPIEQTEQMQQWMPNARPVVVFDETGHDVVRERPDKFLKTAERFWRAVGSLH